MTARRAAALAAAVAALAAGCGSGDDGSSSTRPEEPEAGGWKTWVVPSPEAVRVPPPPPEGSPAARRDERGLEAALRERSEVVVGLARRVERQPAVQPWLERAMEFVASREKDPPASSRNYALVAVAMHDAVVAAWHWKYRYNRPPPQADALFEPPADPAYPSEHAAVAGAAARVLAHLYPDESAARLEQEAGEIGQSRIDAGVAKRSPTTSSRTPGATGSTANGTARGRAGPGTGRRRPDRRPDPCSRSRAPGTRGCSAPATSSGRRRRRGSARPASSVRWRR
jgi:hypothetical protein